MALLLALHACLYFILQKKSNICDKTWNLISVQKTFHLVINLSFASLPTSIDMLPSVGIRIDFPVGFPFSAEIFIILQKMSHDGKRSMCVCAAPPYLE